MRLCEQVGRVTVARLVPVLLVIAAFVGCLPPSSAEVLGGRLSGVISHVVDGDTLVMSVGQRSVTLRLEGIDAPERGQPFSAEARRHLRVLAFAQQATARVTTTDRYGRLVARVDVAGKDLSEDMVASGLAWHFRRYSSDPRLSALEGTARARRFGLWSQVRAIAPWEFRHAERSGGAARPVTPAPPSVSAPYHGNARSRVFHSAQCSDYNCRHCTVAFASPQEAAAAGYRPHASCALMR